MQYKHNRKSLNKFDPVLWAAREWNNDDVSKVVYIIQDGGYDINVDTDKVLT